MNSIYSKEEQVVLHGEVLLANQPKTAVEAAENYRILLGEYKKLLNQMKTMIKVSDLMQLELKRASEGLKKMSMIDVLTGLFNRRFFNENYLKEWHQACRSKTSLAMLMVDIDYFKKYNDTYGHLRGDDCLVAVAKEIQQIVKRPRDLVARFGGEEFMVLLPETDTHGAEQVAERILNGIRRLALEHRASAIQPYVTVSVGVAAAFPDDESMNELLNRVDQALYQAKNQGRNCYRVYQETETDHAW